MTMHIFPYQQARQQQVPDEERRGLRVETRKQAANVIARLLEDLEAAENDRGILYEQNVRLQAERDAIKQERDNLLVQIGRMQQRIHDLQEKVNASAGPDPH